MIDPELVSIKGLNETQTVPLELTTLFPVSGEDGELGNNVLNNLAVFLAPYIASIGASGYVEVNSLILPNPTAKDNGFSIVGEGVYSQTTGSDIVTEKGITILSWNGITWSIATKIPVDVNISNLTVVYEGDSLTDVGPNGYSYNWPSVLPLINPAIASGEQINVAQAGDQVQAYIEGGQYMSQVYPHRPKSYKDVSLFFFEMGTNDLAVGRTPEQLYNNLKTVWAQAKADNFTVIAIAIPRSTNPTRDSGAVLTNQLIRSNYALFDHLIPLDLILPDPTDLSLFLPDGIHLTPLGANRFAGMASIVIDNQLNSRQIEQPVLSILNGCMSLGADFNTKNSKIHIKGYAGSAFPSTTGVDQSKGLVARIQDASSLAIDIGGFAANGGWIQVCDANNLAINYPLFLNKNGGEVNTGGNLNVNGKIKTSTGIESSGEVLISNSVTIKKTGIGGITVVSDEADGIASIRMTSSDSDGAPGCVVDLKSIPSGVNSASFTISTRDGSAVQEAFRVTPEGRIGIKTINPIEALDVTGKARVSLAPTNPTDVVRKQDLDAKFVSPKFTGVSEYADNAAALAASLSIGAIYRTGDVLKIVH